MSKDTGPISQRPKIILKNRRHKWSLNENIFPYVLKFHVVITTKKF